MSLFDFFDLLNEDPFTYFICLVISVVLFIGVMKRTSSSWLNPIRFNIFTFSIGFSVILFLNFKGFVSSKTFAYLLICIAVYWGTFMSVFKNKQWAVNISFVDEPIIAKYLFYVTYTLYILVTLFSYKLLGIPIFNENSRLVTYTGSGLGFIERISPVLYIYSLFYIIHLFSIKSKMADYIKTGIVLLPLIVIGILSGSRSSFLGIIFAFWGYRTFYRQKEPQVNDYKWLIIPFVVISIFTFSIQSLGDYTQASINFLQRIVASGDLYWEALPNDAWQSVVVARPFEFVFMGFLGPLHILNPNLAEIPIGFQLTNITYTSINDASTGPVALFPVTSLVLFGYVGGLLFTFFQALFASLLFKLSYVKSNSIIICAMMYFTLYSIITLIGDISAGLGACLDVLVCFAFIFILIMTIAFIFYRKIDAKIE
ncbi:MAG: O-antigen ligase [Paludibacter sp.]|nr:O-antigen ligase [Paludibacter sp.]